MAAAPPEYRAGSAGSQHVRAVVVEDRRGYRAVFAEADSAITRAASDFVAAQLVKRYEMDRAAIVISGGAAGAADPAEILGTIEQALGRLQAATLAISDVISLRGPGGVCVASLHPVRIDGCREGAPVHGTIRAAFRMIDVPHVLQGREALSRAYPVQAVAVGRQATVLALGGKAPVERFAAVGRIVVPFANDDGPWPESARVDAAVAGVLKSVR